MKPIALDQFKEYTFLSSLSVTADKTQLYFIRTRVNMEKNGYEQQLMTMNTTEKKAVPAGDWKERVSYTIIGNDVFVLDKDPENKTTHTLIKKITDAGKETVLTVPLGIGRILDFDKNHYLVSAQTNRACPDYHALSEEEKKAYDQSVEDNKDYIVFDEYPFVFNGAGVINGNRNSLFLVNKKTGAAKKIVPDTFDVGSFEIIKGKLIFVANDFTTFKTKWDKIYSYNARTHAVEEIYGERMQIHRVFEQDGKIYVKGTFGKDWGEMEAGKIYELKNGQMILRADTEYSMYNSIATDCHYGRTKGFDHVDGVNYFVTTDRDRGVLLKLNQGNFEKVINLNGSVDDFVFGPESIFMIGTLKQDLQEIYEVIDNKAKKLTSFNTKTLRGCYVSKPERLTVNRAVPVDGWVMKPINYDPSKKYPVILDIHGGPKAAYSDVFYHEMQYWAGQGYFVMYCNPRGSDGKGNQYADLRHQWGGIDYSDIMAFVDTVLAKYPAIDEERMGVTGGSYGGYMTNWIIGQTNRFKAAATQRSISNWISEVCVSDYGIDFPIEQEFGDVNNCAAELWGMSPLKFANNAVTPTLFIHSTEDYRCPVPEALQLYTALTCRGVETRMVLFKGENHELSRSGKPLHRIRRLSEITTWMDKHLKNTEE